MLEYCFEHDCEAEYNRDHPLVEVDALTNARADIDLTDPDADAGPTRARVTVGEELEKFLALSPKRQLAAGRKARQAASKVELVDVPTCGKCATPSVLDPCSRCNERNPDEKVKAGLGPADRATRL